MAKTATINYRVTEDHIVFETSQGKFKLPLDVKVKVLRKMRLESDDIDAFFALLDALGDTATANLVDDLGMLEVTRVIEAYFDEFQKFMEKSMGE